jgi:hypothetical protein
MYIMYVPALNNIALVTYVIEFPAAGGAVSAPL